MSAKRVARFGMLTAVALVLGYLEHLVPIAPGMPGVKLGLGNMVVLYALYITGKKSATLLMLLKVGLSALLFGASPIMLFISFGGGLCSLLMMMGARELLKVPIVVVSILGAVAHVAGQLAVVALLEITPWSFVLGYLPILAVSAVATGTLTGVVGKYLLKALRIAAHKDEPDDQT